MFWAFARLFWLNSRLILRPSFCWGHSPVHSQSCQSEIEVGDRRNSFLTRCKHVDVWTSPFWKSSWNPRALEGRLTWKKSFTFKHLSIKKMWNLKCKKLFLWSKQTLRRNRPHSEMININMTDKVTISQFEQIEPVSKLRWKLMTNKSPILKFNLFNNEMDFLIEKLL